MKKIAYTRQDGGVSIVVPAPKDRLEIVLGSLSESEYENHVMERSIPKDVTNVRSIEESDIPTSREFRDAWEDSQLGNQIDINCEKTRDMCLEKLRKNRSKLFDEQDKLFIIASEKGEDTSAIISEKERLRGITNPLKSLSVVGKYNDEVLLQQIRDLSSL